MIFIRFFERGCCWGFQIDGDEEMKCIAGAKAPTKMKRRPLQEFLAIKLTVFVWIVKCIFTNSKIQFLNLVSVLMKDTTKMKCWPQQGNLAIKLTLYVSFILVDSCMNTFTNFDKYILKLGKNTFNTLSVEFIFS